MRSLAFAVALVATACSAALAADAETQVSLRICATASDNPVDRAWIGNVVAALGRLSYSGYRDAQGRLSFQPVFDDTAECRAKAAGGCFGTKGLVYCDGPRLARVLRGIGWVAVSTAASMTRRATAANDAAIDLRPSLTMIDGMELADTVDDGEKFKQSLKRLSDRGTSNEELLQLAVGVRALQAFDASPQLPASPDPLVVSAYTVYEAASNYLFAYIVGHELAHGLSKCVHTAESHVEKSGFFAKLAAAQSSSGPLCPDLVLVDELLADRCGLRGAERMDHAMLQYKMSKFPDEYLKPMLALLSASRRIAIDAVGILLTLGLSEGVSEISWKEKGADGLATMVHVAKFRDGYLNESIRLAAFAGLLHELEPYSTETVRICDVTAQDFVLGLNMGMVRCLPKDENTFHQKGLPELFAEVVPPGVLKGWRTGEWNDRDLASFRCKVTSTPRWGAHLMTYPDLRAPQPLSDAPTRGAQ